MRAGHGKNMRGAINQRGGERLAAQIADIDALLFANLHCVKAWRLPAHGMHPCRRDFNIFAIANQTPKEPFRDGATANVTRADKENAFHDSRRASARMNNLKSNMIKSIERRPA
jgi:hypothetical protein